MTSGFKDWDVPISISAQEIAEVINRPKYGSIQTLVFQDNINTDAETSLGTISGKGMIYGGFINVGSSSSNINAYIRTTIDTVLMSGQSPANLLLYSLTTQHSSIPYLVLYDNINFSHTMAFSYGITFESSLEITIFRHAGVQASVTMYLYYALI